MGISIKHSGLWAGEQAIPLEGVRMESRVTGLCSQTTVTQRYRNKEAQAVEAVYVFPLEEGAAISGFRVYTSDRELEGQIEEREEAFERYDDAMADGHGAFLLDQERPNVFTASVGNVKPGQEVEIEITYAAMLNLEGDAIRLLLPTTISPRYVPSSTPAEVGQPDGERVNPPTRARVPYGLELEVKIEGEGGVRGLESPSHAVRARIEEDGATVTLAQDKPALDRDFVLLIELAEPHRPRAYVAGDDQGRRVAMVSFIPSFDDLPEKPQDVVFLLDCSGSMQGPSIEQARRALAVALRTLREGDRFNIVRFGSTHTTLWNTPRDYNQAHLDKATAYAQAIQADLGGTEIYSALSRVLSAPRVDERLRQVFVLTDGQVSNEDQIIELCAAHRDTSRVFSFGIGNGVNEHFIRGMARASGGVAELIYPGERIEPKVIRMVGRARTPRFEKIDVDWGGLDVEQAPASPPAVFKGEALTILARVRGGASDRVALSADSHRWAVPLDLEHAVSGGPVPSLWARAAIRDLEEGKGLRRGGSQQRRGNPEDRARKRIITLSREYGIMSSFTSFVAIEHRAEADKETGAIVLRPVPQALTRGWGGTAQANASMTRAGSYQGSMDAMSLGGMAPGAPAQAPAGAPSQSRGGFIERAKGKLSRNKKRRSRKKMARAEGMAPPPPAASAPSFSHEERERSAPRPRPARPASPPVLSGDVGPAGPDLYDLLLSQQADGSFPLSAALQTWAGDALWDQARAAAASHDPALVATVLALHVLETQARSRRDEWSSVADKARRWLAAQGSQLTIEDIRAS